jgi:UTP--glucose-1-phosphate uridylyltransferase
MITDFDGRFPTGAPSLSQARSLTVQGDWSFEAGVRVIGAVTLQDRGNAQIVAAGSTLGDQAG